MELSRLCILATVRPLPATMVRMQVGPPTLLQLLLPDSIGVKQSNILPACCIPLFLALLLW